MKVFCPNCGSENEGIGGGRVVCRACTATFDVPTERPSQAAPPPQAPPGAPSATAPVQPYAPPAGYPMPGHSVPPMKQARPTNILAVVSLVSGLLCCPPVALITGFIGFQQVNQSEGRQGGKEIAIVGMVLGVIGLCFSVLYAIGMASSHH